MSNAIPQPASAAQLPGVTPELIEQAKRATPEEKLEAVLAQTAVIRQAQRDQLVLNQRLHNKWTEKNRANAELRKQLREEQDRVEEMKRQRMINKLSLDCNPTIPLPELQAAVEQSEQELLETRERVRVSEDALVRLLAYKEIVEEDVLKQTSRSEKGTQDLATRKRELATLNRQNRELGTEIADLGRKLKKLNQEMQDTRSHAKSLDRHNRHLEATLNQFRTDFQALNKARNQTKQQLVEQVRTSEETDKLIEQMKLENSQLMQLMLERFGPDALEPLPPKLDAETVRRHEEAAKAEEADDILREALPQVVLAKTAKTKTQMEMEADLLKQYESVLQATASQFGCNKRL